MFAQIYDLHSCAHFLVARDGEGLSDLEVSEEFDAALRSVTIALAEIPNDVEMVRKLEEIRNLRSQLGV